MSPSHLSAPAATLVRRLVIVTNHLMVGGAEKQIVALAPAFQAAGFEIHIVSILPTVARMEDVERLGIPVTHLRLVPGMRGLSAIVGAARVLRRLRPDIVVSFVYQANVLARVAATMAGVPVVVSSIRNEFFGPRWRDWLLRATDRLCTITTTNSELVARSLVDRRIVPAHRLRVIPNGIDTIPYGPAAAGTRTAARAALGLDEATFVWLFLGKLDAQKDVSNLLRAFALHTAAFPGSRLCLAGDGPLRPSVEALAVELGLGDRAQFLGIRGDVPELLAAADALVLSSAWEGLPNVVMEAMAAARPVVATSVGGVAELVDDGVTGFTAPRRDPPALAAAMGRLTACQPSERTAMGARGRTTVEQRYSMESAADLWLALLGSCATANARGRVHPA